MSAQIRQILNRHDNYLTAAIARYTDRLGDVVARATGGTLVELQRKLDVRPNGVIANTPKNSRVLRGLDNVFADQMEAEGFGALNRSFVGQFAGQLPYLDMIIEHVGEHLDRPLPDVRQAIRAEDRRILATQQASTVAGLNSVVDTVAALAKRQALFSMAALSSRDLAQLLATSLRKTIPQAETIADTAQVVFYRTATDRAFQVIEKDLPGFEVRYEYEGPDDKITRPFCRQMLRMKKTYTRAEIDRMSNGQFPAGMVWSTCGGWNCRHQWMIAL